jgi:hypothetical protein
MESKGVGDDRAPAIRAKIYGHKNLSLKAGMNKRKPLLIESR